jgi:5-formyltetrahydrofolate cyclo-ligase
MVFARVACSKDLVEGQWGLLEPADACMEVGLVEIDVVFTPLVAFDAAGNRLGRGKGFYDRAFAQKTDSASRPAQLRIGLAHDFQLVHRLTPQAHDVPLHAVVTPTQSFGSLDR